jgi:hypothetical protein
MADLTGIENAGEFFSAHYLQERLPEELKGQDAEVAKALDDRTSKLRAAGSDMLRALADAGAMTVSGRADVAHDLCVRLLEAFGYDRSSSRYAVLDREGSSNHAVPLLSELRHGDLPYVFVLEAGLPYEGEALLEQRIAGLSPLPDEALEAGLSLPPDLTVDETVAALFASTEPPRWVVVLGAREAVLAERGRLLGPQHPDTRAARDALRAWRRA